MKEPTWGEYIIHKLTSPLRWSWQSYFFFCGIVCFALGLGLEISWQLGLLGLFLIVYPIIYSVIGLDFNSWKRQEEADRIRAQREKLQTSEKTAEVE